MVQITWRCWFRIQSNRASSLRYDKLNRWERLSLEEGRGLRDYSGGNLFSAIGETFDDLADLPRMVCRACLHCSSSAQRFVDAAEVVVHVVRPVNRRIFVGMVRFRRSMWPAVISDSFGLPTIPTRWHRHVWCQDQRTTHERLADLVKTAQSTTLDMTAAR
jgi:hypothetical protein